MNMTKNKNKKILITGTHTTPALTVHQELKNRGYRNFLWVGQRKSIIGSPNFSTDVTITQKNKIPFANIFAGKLSKTLSIHSLIWWLRIPIGYIQSFWIFAKFKPDILITFGSHVGLPLAFAAKTLGIPILHHQQGVISGMSDQHIQKLADIVCYSWEASTKYLPDDRKNHKYVFTGNPLRKEILNPKHKDFGFTNQRELVLVVGGNQGCHAINQVIAQSIHELTKKYNVIHQTGADQKTNDFTKHLEIAKKINKKSTKYVVADYLFANDLGSALDQAALVVSRSGANFCYEFAALGKQVILIPLPTSIRDEQRINAQLMKSTGLAKVIEQEEFTPDSLLQAIQDKFEVKTYIEKAQQKAKDLIRFDAAENIATQAEKLLS